MTCGGPRCQHEFCWFCLDDWTSAMHDASFCIGSAEASHSEVLASMERQIRSNWALHANDTQPAVDTYAKEVLQCFRVALTTCLERDAELLSAEIADVLLCWRRFLEFYDHCETRIRATAQFVFADVVDSHCAQQELIELLSWVRDRWLRLSSEDVDEHNESFMDPLAFLELPCPVRRQMRAERVFICLEQHFGSQLVEHEQDLVANAEALALGTTELRWELQQARMQVSRGSGLAEQQQRQLESAPVEPVPERLGTLRTKTASDPFWVSSLAFGSSNDCWTQCGFLRVSMKSLLWLGLLREIVAENTKEECETVFCAICVKVPKFYNCLQS